MDGLIGCSFFESHTCLIGFGRKLVVATIEVFVQEVGFGKVVVLGNGFRFLGSQICR